MIIFVLIIGLILRLISITQSLWLDEGINVIFARSLSYKDLIFNYSLGDFHPPLYHILLKSWIWVFSSSEISVRMPSVILGLGVVYITFKIGQKLYDTKTGVIAAILIATGPLHIYYSQEARMYMLAAFFASLSVYFFISILTKDKLLYWIGFIFSTTLMLYSDYLPYLLIPTYGIYLLYFRKRISSSKLKSFIPAFLLIFFFLLPWLFIFPHQLKGGLAVAAATPAWARAVGSSSLKDLALIFVKFTIGRISVDNNFIYALLFLPVGLYVTLLALISTLRISVLRSFLWFYFLIPIIFAFLLSYFIPVFAYFRLLFVLPAIYILLSSAINNLSWSLPSRILLFIMLLINLTSATIYFTNPKFQREDWKNAARFVKENSTGNSIALFESTYSIAPFDYYNNGKVEAKGVLDSFNPTKNAVTENVKSYTQNKNKVFLFQYLIQITDPQGLAFQALVDNGFTNTKTDNFQGVGFVYEFTK